MERATTMKAVVFNGPWKIDIEDRPKPQCLEPTDAVLKVSLAGICGSELHMYRGYQKTDPGHIMGHEFTGTIESIGTGVKNLAIGQRVVTTFSAVCKSCWFCKHSYTNRCIHGMAFGTQALAGGQAEFVRVPFAEGTLKALPDDVPDDLAVMMCDIFPTGFYGASRALGYFATSDFAGDHTAQYSGANLGSQQQSLSKAVFVCLGCGPVGLCAILTACSKGVRTIYAVDSVDDRLAEAKSMGAIPLKLGSDDISAVVMGATQGRGADAVIEVVGSQAALRSAFDLLRPCGVLSSIGFHQGNLPFSALESYQKNINIHMGRAPVQGVFDEAFETAMANKAKLIPMITHRLPLAEAAKGYSLFEKQLARKVVLIPRLPARSFL